jgi:CRP-like cAMP-binding protein
VVSKIEFLRKLPIFSELNDKELEGLARITDEYEFEAGAAIAYQRDIADRFYIVSSGRLVGRRVDEQGLVQERKFYMAGDYFEDVWLFTPRTHEMTVNAAAPGRMMIIEEKKFLPFLVKNPGILDALELSDEAWYEAERTQAALPGRRARKLNLLTEEIVEFYERRTSLLLLVEIIIPIILWFTAGYFAIDWWLSNQRLIGALAGLFSAAMFFLSAFFFIDWWNDYFVITNKHLVHHEFDLRRLQIRIDKVPIDQVQSVQIVRPNLLQTLLNVGTARITTASRAGVLLFDFIHDPKAVEETINKLRQRVLAMDAGRVQASMRASIEEHFEAPPAYKKVTEPGVVTADFGPQFTLWDRIRRAVASRVEDGNTITYRKHVFSLLRLVWWQIVLGGLFLLIAFRVPEIWELIVFGVLFLIVLGIFIWRFEDWRNDTFQVTDRYVIDIDRTPFGFGESRKQAELGNVQNVNADRPGLLNTIFNYGYVYIETAGASANINFERVVNPSRIQSDIFQRREQFAQNQRIREGQQRRKEYAVFIDAFRQATEQNRLPARRTPPLDELDEMADFPENEEPEE